MYNNAIITLFPSVMCLLLPLFRWLPRVCVFSSGSSECDQPIRAGAYQDAVPEADLQRAEGVYPL